MVVLQQDFRPAHSSPPGPPPASGVVPAAVWSPRPFRLVFRAQLGQVATVLSFRLARILPRPFLAVVLRAFRRTLGGPIAAVPAAVQV